MSSNFRQNMDQPVMDQPVLSSGLELAGLVESSGVLAHAWAAVTSLHTDGSTRLGSVNYIIKRYKPNITIVAFESSSSYGTAEEVVGGGSEMMNIGSPSMFDFIATKVNPSFSIHNSSLHLFSSIQNELPHLKQQLGETSPLIITGHSLGGSVASLFTLWLLNDMSFKNTKPPLCITFGSPLLGDTAFQRAIAERPLWNGCFLHVVSDQDLIPRLLISSQDVLSNGTTTQTSSYKPFGTFLICSDSGCTCFEDSEAILDVLRALKVGNDLSRDPSRFSRNIDYGSILETLKNKTIRKGTSMQNKPVIKRHRFGNYPVIDPLQAEIMLQLGAAGIKNIEQETDATRSLISQLKERQVISSGLRKNRFDPNKKLNEMKIHMTYLEWYKKMSMNRGGYYDKYKNKSSGKDEVIARSEIRKCQRMLTQYWTRMISEVEKMPVQELVLFRTRWFFSGTNYRRMIEPLDIAEYYKEGKGNRDYVNSGRSQHYVLLQQWLNDNKSGENPKERNQACSLTEDSCFWAYVEEAIISCKTLKDGASSLEDKTSAKDNLKTFEQYVMKEIENCAVSPEVFHPESSFMQWWNEYSAMEEGSSYNSRLSYFMKYETHMYV